MINLTSRGELEFGEGKQGLINQLVNAYFGILLDKQTYLRPWNTQELAKHTQRMNNTTQAKRIDKYGFLYLNYLNQKVNQTKPASILQTS